MGKFMTFYFIKRKNKNNKYTQIKTNQILYV